MALKPRFLADKSALARLPNPSVEKRLGPLILGGEIATCSIIELEVLYSARSHRELVQIRKEREAAFPNIEFAQVDFDRAIEVMAALAASGHHRSAGIPDLLVAAVAERSGLAILHYDQDFDRIASVTGQKVEWVVKRGSVP